MRRFGFPALQAPSPFTAAPAASLAHHFDTAAEQVRQRAQHAGPRSTAADWGTNCLCSLSPSAAPTACKRRPACNSHYSSRPLNVHHLQVLAACSAYAAAHPGCPAWLLSLPSSNGGGGSTPGSYTALPLTEWHATQQQARGQGGRLCLAMADCSNLPANPGWPLRNLLLMAAARCGCVCGGGGRNEEKRREEEAGGAELSSTPVLPIVWPLMRCMHQSGLRSPL